MSDLTFNEKFRLERLLEMGGGYVLDFTNRTFQEFILDTSRKNIFDDKYNNGSGSKANRLRAFWVKEPNQVVGKLLFSLLDYYKEHKGTTDLFCECQEIVLRLSQDSAVEDVEAIAPNTDSRDFDALAKSVKDCIEKNEPELGLDRLHTFVVKYVRVLCEKNGVKIDRDKPLHSLFGEYVKHLRSSGQIESEMTDRILKSSISVLEAFNHVRNERSFAHDNPVLNYNESLLIFNNVASSIRFITTLEESSTRKQEGNEGDTPFSKTT